MTKSLMDQINLLCQDTNPKEVKQIVTKKKEFYTSKYDKVFKTVFADINNTKFINAILSEVLEGDAKVIKFLNSELGVRNVNEKVKHLDLLVDLGGTKVNVEINTNSDLATKVRNFSYFTSFISQNTVVGDKYDTKLNFVQICFNFEESKSKKAIRHYKLQTDDLELYLQTFHIYAINMDKLSKVWYDKSSEEFKKYKYLGMVDMEKEDLEKFGKDDELLKEYGKRVIELNNDESFTWDISPEDDERYLMNARLAEAEERGIETGAEKRNIEIVKNFYKMGLSIENIAKGTNLSVDEVNEILAKENKQKG